MKSIENIMSTKTLRLSDILQAGRIYKVPTFQRDYSWKEEHWEDLWEDLENIELTNKPHYMGAVIFKLGKNDDEYIIVDGQQRLATLTIIAVASITFLSELIEIREIEPEKNKERINIFTTRFIGEKDAKSLFYRSKLHLNRNDDPFFQEYILKRKKPISISKLYQSQKQLYRCYKYFKEKIFRKFGNDNGEKISEFLDDIVAKKLVFIQITVEDDVSAYTVFETLNARGIELAPTDLLKNYLLSLISETDIDIIEEKWYRIINLIGFKQFPTFLRYYLNSFRDIVRKQRLFKELKKEVRTSEEALKLLDELETIAYFYAALKDPYDEFWNEFPNNNKIREYITTLNLFEVTQQLPLLIAIFRFNRKLLINALRIATVIAFRYNVIGKLNPNSLEKAYNRVAVSISKRKIQTAKEIFNELKSVYINDEEFINAFSLASINADKNKKLVKYILLEIEKKLSGQTYALYDSSISIEHILPKNPSRAWINRFPDSEIEENINRLGNLTLLEPTKNQKVKNKSFTEKLQVYKDAKFQITKEICDFEEWNKETIIRRQKRMANIAKGIWRLDY